MNLHELSYKAGKAGGNHPKPGDLRLSGIAGAKPVESHLQGQLRYHSRQYGLLGIPWRKRADHAEGVGSGAGQGNHRHL